MLHSIFEFQTYTGRCPEVQLEHRGMDTPPCASYIFLLGQDISVPISTPKNLQGVEIVHASAFAMGQARAVCLDWLPAAHLSSDAFKIFALM